MNLQTILYGQFTPPPVIDSRKYSMWSNGANPYPGYTPPVNRDTKYKTITPRIIQALTDNPGASRGDLAKILNITTSYLYRAIDFLLEGGLIYGKKGKPIKGGYQTTVYYVKD